MINKIRTQKVLFCKICGSRGKYKYRGLVDQLFGVNGIWNIKKCKNVKCETLWLDPKPINKDIYLTYKNYYTHNQKNNENRIFDKIIKGYQSVKFKYMKGSSNIVYITLGLCLSSFKFFKERMDYPFIYFKNVKKGRLLELGAGNGRDLNILKKWGFDVEGLEIDSRSIALMKQKGLRAYQGDIFSQNFKMLSYDVIFSNHVIEHTPNPKKLIFKSYKLLKPGGAFIGITPNSGSILHFFLKSSWRGLEPPRHLQILNADTLRNIAQESGFSRVEIKTSNFAASYIFYSSFLIKQKNFLAHDKNYILKSMSLLVRLALNFVHYFFPLSGEELIVIAYK